MLMAKTVDLRHYGMRWSFDLHASGATSCQQQREHNARTLTQTSIIQDHFSSLNKMLKRQLDSSLVSSIVLDLLGECLLTLMTCSLMFFWLALSGNFLVTLSPSRLWSLPVFCDRQTSSGKLVTSIRN